MTRTELEQRVTAAIRSLPWWDQTDQDPDITTVPDDLLIELLQDLGEEI